MIMNCTVSVILLKLKKGEIKMTMNLTEEKYFNWEAKFPWTLKAKKLGKIRAGDPVKGEPPIVEEETFPVQSEIENELFPKMETEIISKFAEQAIQKGHWFRVNSVENNVSSFEVGYDVVPYSKIMFTPCNKHYVIKGESTVNFDSDIDENETGSGLLMAIVMTAVAIALAHPVWVLAIVTIIALSIGTVAFQQSGGVKGILFGAGSEGIVGDVGTIIIVIGAFILLLIFAGVFGGKSKK